MELIDCFHKPGTLDNFTFVFSDCDPRTGYYAMLATSTTGRDFSQRTEGIYEPGGTNSHLGERPRVIGEQLVMHVLGKLGDAVHFATEEA